MVAVVVKERYGDGKLENGWLYLLIERKYVLVAEENMEIVNGWQIDTHCGGTPSGGCVVGRCWEACSSWVPVPLFGLSSWLAG